MNSIRLKEIGRKIIRPSVAVLLVILTACDMPEMKTTNKIAYHFDEPARMWEETLPLGNGRLGMMPDGGIDRENILLNEISMWSGSKQAGCLVAGEYTPSAFRRKERRSTGSDVQNLCL